MAKLTLNDVGSLIDATTAANTINNNSDLIETAMENTFSLNGTTPNTLNTTLDMNSHRILNLPAPVYPIDALRLQDLTGNAGIPAGGTTGQVLAKTTSADYAVNWQTNVASGVSSVGLALPADFTVTNSPVTSTGTLTGAWAVTPTGTGAVVRATSPTLVTPALGTPTALVGTNITGTAAGLIAGAVTTNANLTGPITSTGNATAIASQTGTGSTFVTSVSPTVSTTLTVSGTNSLALAVGQNGATNPALRVDTTTASSITGVVIGSGATGTGVDINALGGTNETIRITPKGTGVVNLQGDVQVNANKFTVNGTTGNTTVAGTLGVTGATTTASVNKVTITAPATSATLTIPNGVTLTGPASSGTAMTLGNTETVTGVKTFGSAGAVGRLSIAGTTSGTTVLDATATASGTLTLPAATDTLIGKATTDILTNKTYDTAGTGNSFSINGVAANANTGTGSVVRATSPTITTPNITGTTAVGNATAGSIGEVIEASLLRASRTTLVTSTSKTLCSISLTAGDWDVSGQVGILVGATTSATNIEGSISIVNNTVDGLDGATWSLPGVAAASVDLLLAVPTRRVNVSSTTTVYLVGFCTFTSTAPEAYGHIYARRMR